MFAVAVVLLRWSGIGVRAVIDRGFLNEAFHFSLGNYLAGLFMAAPNLILPIMVLNVLEAEQAAYYYIAYAIAALLFMIPSAISMSLFVEGSHGEALKRTVVKSLVVIFLLLVPAATVLYVSGGWVLGVVGAEYAAGGAGVLRVMVVASLFVGMNYVYFAIKRVQRDVKGVVVLSGVIFVSLVGLGYLFMTIFGVVGALVCVVGGKWGRVRVRGGDGVEGGVGLGRVGGAENQTLSVGFGDLMSNTFIRLNTICIHAPEVVHIQDEG